MAGRWGWGGCWKMSHTWGHMNAHKVLDTGTDTRMTPRNTHTTPGLRHTQMHKQNTLPPHGPLWLRTLIKTHGHGDLGRQELHLQRQESILGRDLPWALLCGGGGVPLQG